MKIHTSSALLALALSFAALAALAQAKNDQPSKPAQSIPELRAQLEKILADTHTPGVSVALVHRDGPEWIDGVGKADVAANRPVTADTLFRIGSTSKAFASLSILKLAGQGKLSLLDPVHKLVPEVWFGNPWESTDPVLVVDLLEHTTGWDDMHLREFAKDAKGFTTLEGLAYDHRSRTSRWPPGTRMSYSNSGPAVAAAIVEKISGQRFEDYVAQNFFAPIGMKSATYFDSPQLTALYHGDGKTAYPYWNILLRPAGAINASARDMAAYVQFYLNRGSVGGVEIMPPTIIDRMETPTRSWSAQQGLKAGYGLSVYTSIHDGFVYHGHNGGVQGGLTDMSYLPEYGVGYFYSINSGNPAAFNRVGDAIRAYLTRNLSRPALPAAAPLPGDDAHFAGWYQMDSTRLQLTHFVDRLALQRIRFAGGKMIVTNMLGLGKQTFLPVAGNQFRILPDKGAPDPVASAILYVPGSGGRFATLGMGATFKRIPTWFALGEILLLVWFVLALASILLYAPFWTIGGLFKKRRRPAERWVRLWPLIAALSLILFVLIMILSGDDALARLGNLTVFSFGLFLATLLFAFASLAGAYALWRARNREIRKYVRGYSIAVSVILLIAAIYMACWGVIGIRTWG